jgi:hypothetical protein
MLHKLIGFVPHRIIAGRAVKQIQFIIDSVGNAIEMLASLLFLEPGKLHQQSPARDGVNGRHESQQNQSDDHLRFSA